MSRVQSASSTRSDNCLTCDGFLMTLLGVLLAQFGDPEHWLRAGQWQRITLRFDRALSIYVNGKRSVHIHKVHAPGAVVHIRAKRTCSHCLASIPQVDARECHIPSRCLIVVFCCFFPTLPSPSWTSLRAAFRCPQAASCCLRLLSAPACPVPPSGMSSSRRAPWMTPASARSVQPPVTSASDPSLSPSPMSNPTASSPNCMPYVAHDTAETTCVSQNRRPDAVQCGHHAQHSLPFVAYTTQSGHSSVHSGCLYHILIACCLGWRTCVAPGPARIGLLAVAE